MGEARKCQMAQAAAAARTVIDWADVPGNARVPGDKISGVNVNLSQAGFPLSVSVLFTDGSAIEVFNGPVVIGRHTSQIVAPS